MARSNKSTRQFMEDGAAQAAVLLRAVSNERRLLVLCLLIEHGERSVGALLEHVDLSQSALSQHLARMRDDGLVTFRRDAQSLHYSIVDHHVKRLIDALKTIYCP